MAVAAARPAGAGSARFWRERRRAAVDVSRVGLLPAPVFTRRPRGPVARLLLVPEDAELVTRRRLHGQTQVGDAITERAARLAGEVGFVGPRRRIAGVPVGVHPGHRAIGALVAEDRVVPEPVALHRSADAEAVVPELQELAGRAQTGRAQLLGVIAADHALRDTRHVEDALDRVAPRSRHDAHRRTT